MFTRLLLAVILSAIGAQCASAGVLVRAEQVPEAVNSMSAPVDEGLPIVPTAVEKGGLDWSVTVVSTYTSLSAVALSAWSTALANEAPLAETIRVWSATLPTCPFLEVKLKPA